MRHSLSCGVAATMLVALAFVGCARDASADTASAPFSLTAVMSYPFPSELTAAATGQRLAWALNEGGLRNLFVAEGPTFEPRQLTHYGTDDGQELTSVTLSVDGEHVVYVRGGEHASNWDRSVPVNALSMPLPPRLQLLSVPFAGGEPRLLAEGGDAPVVSPRGDVVAFVRGGQIWTVPIDASAPARLVVAARGQAGSLQWSPDGARLAFVSSRETHALIGIYQDEATPILWVAPSTNRDQSPRWSADGQTIAFVRRPGSGGVPQPILGPRHQPWAIWVADTATGAARQVWAAPAIPRGNPPSTHGGINLHVAADDRVVFATEIDGWPHLYSLPTRGDGPAEPLLLTPGAFMVEHVRLAADRRSLIFMANTGPAPDDIDRRHLVRVSVDRADAEVLTPGLGIESAPVVTGDGAFIAFISATMRRPPVPAVMPARGGAPKLLGADRIPTGFPTDVLVEPKQVIYRAPDGLPIHAQLFEQPGGPSQKPAIVYVHGGPARQMLLGWHYGDYYANAYAMNQYLASRGYVVLAVNFRRGIGYGHDFQHAENAGPQGASEYQDVRAGGEYLRGLPQVDAGRVGVYGGSYGGYLTALALARDSDLFASGVDIHGVHDFASNAARRFGIDETRHEAPPDRAEAVQRAWESSPVSSIATWRSPVLLIHGDDDRNVRVSETVDLVQRLRAAGVRFEEILIPDETHHFMRFAVQRQVNEAVADFFERTLGGGDDK